MRWIDTKTDAKIKLAKLPDGSVNLLFLNVPRESRVWGDAVRHMRMRVSSSGRALVRSTAKFSLDEIRRVFPEAVPVDIPESEVYIGVKGVAQDADARRVSADIKTYIPIGFNYRGQEVFRAADGTRFVNAATGAAISENSAAVPAGFLRAPTPEDLALCADGFYLEMSKRMMRPDDVRKFAAALYDEDRPLAPTDTRLRTVQEAIEAAIFRNFAAGNQVASRSAFETACKIENHQPAMVFRSGESVINQQYSTALPISVAAQHILGDVEGLKVLEPTIGNASLVSMLRGARIVGCEIDPARARQAEGIFQGDAQPDIVVGDFSETYKSLPADFDVVIANPPFGGLKKQVVLDGIALTRVDHLIAVQALSLRKDDGQSVFIVAGDYDVHGEEGRITGGSKRFFAWLSDHYEMEAVELDGSLYAKQGANYPVRLIAVGRRYSADEARARKEAGQYPESLPVIKTHADLWDAAASMRQFLDNKEEAEEAESVVRQTEYQAQYTPLSRRGEGSSMIPVNLVAAQRIAFDMLQQKVGDVDAFVQRELQLPDLEAFEPEQIDAIALAIFNAQRGRGLIIADQTGLGKGRCVAALARYAALNGRLAIFLTDTPNLFSDFWRDVADIGSADLFKPFILNSDEEIIDTTETGEVLIPKTPPATQRAIVDGKINPLERGFNLAMMTYSQFSRDGSKKSEWLKTIAEGSYMILDESHKAAGESNIGYNLGNAIARSWSVSYSSATYAKDASNMLIYAKAFPPSVSLETLSETLKAGGETLQEILSAMLCQDGVLIRREHDLSRLKFSILQPPPHIMQRNREVADAASAVLSRLAYLAGDVERVFIREAVRIRDELAELPDEVRAGNRMGVSYVNFGSRLYTIQRQLMLSLAADTVIEHAGAVLDRGGKPVFAVEQTMESLLKDMMGEQTDEIVAVSFRDVLRRALTNVLSISRRDAYGVTEKVRATDIVKEKNDIRALDAEIREIERLIDQVPDVPAMPIDAIKQGMERLGYSVGEVSGRKSETRINNGRMTIIPRNDDRAGEIFRFNNGDYDGIAITSGAAATGTSLHASERFQDRRQRYLYEMQIANDVRRRVQVFGRVDRRGQVSSPEIVSVTSGLPCEVRMLAMQNQKLRAMSANTQSNRNNARELSDIPDILNHVGNTICAEFLMSNPDIARTLAIDITSEREDNEEYFVSKLTGRLSLLPVKQQEEVYETILANYTARIDELTALGLNPFRSHVMDVRASRVRSFVLQQERAGGSVFDAPIIAERIEWQEETDPWRIDDIRETVNAATRRLIGGGVGKQAGTLAGGIELVDLSPYMERVQRAFVDLAIRSVPAKFANAEDPMAGVRAAMGDKGDNIIKKIDSRLEWMLQHGHRLVPGKGVRWTSAEGLMEGVVVDISLPPEGKEGMLGQWSVSIATPGADALTTLTFNQLIQDDQHELMTSSDVLAMLVKFREAPAGLVTRGRWVLSGNLLAATESAARSGIGRAGIYTLKDGTHHRAVICNTKIEEHDLRSMHIVLATPEDAILSISRDVRENTFGMVSFGGNFHLTWSNGMIAVSVPGSKKAGGMIFGDKELVKCIGDFHGNREKMSCTFPAKDAEKLEAVVRKFYSLGMSASAVAERDMRAAPHLK